MNIGSVSERYTGEYAPLPQKYQAAYRFGVRFFEIRYPTPIQSPQPLFGPYDIEVEEEWDTVSLRVRHSARVLSTDVAQVKFVPINNHGLAVAWMFDDEYWHNRVVLCDNDWLYRSLVAMHDPERGVMPGNLIREEIDELRKAITVETPIWKIMNERNIEYTYFESESEAQKRLQLIHKKAETTGNEALLDYYIEQGTKLEKSREAKELIRIYGRQKFGWTDCDEFRTRIRPRVESAVASKQQNVVPSQAMNNLSHLANVLAGIDPNVLVDVIREAKRRSEPTQELSEVETPRQQVSEGPKFSKYGLDRKRVEEIRSIAESLGIEKVDRKRKDELIDAILAKQGTVSESVEQENEPQQEQISTETISAQEEDEEVIVR